MTPLVLGKNRGDRGESDTGQEEKRGMTRRKDVEDSRKRAVVPGQ